MQSVGVGYELGLARVSVDKLTPTRGLITPGSGEELVGGVGGFADMVRAGIEKVQQSSQSAQGAIESFAQDPESVPVERLALLMATAENDLRAAGQVRNRLVSAYQEIMNMQV